jgi:hypothetical protein
MPSVETARPTCGQGGASARPDDYIPNPTVRMSSVSVPEACLKNRPGITTIATPTQMRAAATMPSAEVPTEFFRAIPGH